MRYSKQRNLILNILSSTDTHPTAEWIYGRAREEMPGIGVATVYRNLNALAEAGEIQTIIAPDNIRHFDYRTDDHWHLACQKCGRVRDLTPVSEEQVKEVRRMICDTFDVKDQNVRFGRTLLQGICNDCLRKEQAPDTSAVE